MTFTDRLLILQLPERFSLWCQRCELLKGAALSRKLHHGMSNHDKSKELNFHDQTGDKWRHEDQVKWILDRDYNNIISVSLWERRAGMAVMLQWLERHCLKPIHLLCVGSVELAPLLPRPPVCKEATLRLRPLKETLLIWCTLRSSVWHGDLLPVSLSSALYLLEWAKESRVKKTELSKRIGPSSEGADWSEILWGNMWVTLYKHISAYFTCH